MTTLIGPRIEEEERVITGTKRDKKAEETLKEEARNRQRKARRCRNIYPATNAGREQPHRL